MTILNFEEFSKNDFVVEDYNIDSNIENMIAEISAIVKKNVDIKLDILIDPHFNSKFKTESDIQRFGNIICKAYIQEYLNVLKEYGDCYVEGTGKKTNGYGEPIQNFAYNYINHIDFKKIAKEYPKYDDRNRGVGQPVSYSYFENVWSIACRRVMDKYKNQFNLKLDHRYKNNKNNDFDGTLVIFNPMSNEFWKKKNLYKNQRYSSCLN